MRSEPVVMVHGWGGSFLRTWQEPGWEALLADAGRDVIGVDLLGHGTADKPHDPEAYADLTPAVTAVLPDAPVTTFTMNLNGGESGLIANATDICDFPQVATGKFIAQDNAIPGK